MKVEHECHHKFYGGVWRIRQHFLRGLGSGVGGCEAPPGKLRPVVKVLERLAQESKKEEQQATEKRQYGKARSSAIATAPPAPGKK